jgi:CRISPR-associated endonuclease/helicase Cas3
MHKTYLLYWGKTSSTSQESQTHPEYHPLPFHCLDVAAVAETLLGKDSLIKTRFKRIAELDPILPLIRFFVALHDIGKFSVRFQNLNPFLLRKLQNKQTSLTYSRDLHHSRLGFRLWQDELLPRFKDGSLFQLSIASDSLRWLLNPWFSAVTGHHGRPPNWESMNALTLFEKEDRVAAGQFVRDMAELFSTSKYIETLLEEEDYRLDASTRFSYALAGFTILCDWIGSDERYFFPLPDPGMSLEEYYREFALPRASRAIDDSGILPAPVRNVTSFAELFPEIVTPSPLQSFAESIQASPQQHLYIFEDMTGSGKTEAALIAAHKLMTAEAGEGLYWALPTMATANAMYTRMTTAYKRLFSDDATPSLVLSHSGRHLVDSFQESIGLEDIPSDNQSFPEESGHAQCSAWLADNKKKAFLASAGVGTVDQALLSVLPSTHQALRLLGLARGVLVVDEVHAFDPYVHQLLCKLLTFQAAMGGSAILLSATLPMQTRQELVDAFIRGYGGMEQDVTETSYPLITHVSADSSGEFHLSAREGTERTVYFELVHNEDVLLEELGRISECGGCACWIRNTVDDALDAYHRLWELFSSQDGLDEDNVLLFHARYAMGDRLNLEQAMLEYFGKHSDEEVRRGKILVATQVVEQSLDLDFDLLISDLAPIDLLFQRIGREHRHASRNRPAEYTTPRCLVFSPYPDEGCGKNWFTDFFPRAGLIYPNHGQLWRTARFLLANSTLHFPCDSRRALESVYGDQAVDLPDGLQAATMHAEGEIRAQSDMALGNALRLEEGYKRTQFQWVDDTISPTRLGEPTVTFRLGRVWGGRIAPWHREIIAKKSWGLSEIRVLAYRLSDSAPPETDEEQAARDNALDEMPDQGKYSVLLPMWRIDERSWEGKGVDGNGRHVRVLYDLHRGLLFKDL